MYDFIILIVYCCHSPPNPHNFSSGPIVVSVLQQSLKNLWLMFKMLSHRATSSRTPLSLPQCGSAISACTLCGPILIALVYRERPARARHSVTWTPVRPLSCDRASKMVGKELEVYNPFQSSALYRSIFFSRATKKFHLMQILPMTISGSFI